MLTASDDYKNALRESHQALTRVRLWSRLGAAAIEDPVLEGELDVIDGTLVLDGDAFVRRTCSLKVADTSMLLNGMDTGSWPGASPDYSEITIDYGIQFAWTGAPEFVRVGTLRVQDVRFPGNGVIQIKASDQLSRVVECDIVAPWVPRNPDGSQMTVVNAIKFLVEGAYPTDWPVTWHVAGAIDDTLLTSKNTVFQGSRAAAVERLLAQIDAVMFERPNGSIEISPIMTDSDASPAVWDFTSGQRGVLIEKESADTLEGRYNAVAISYTSGTDDKPVTESGYLYDNRPTSNTYYFGTWGKRTIQKDLSGLGAITLTRAKQIAKQLLDYYLRPYGQTKISAVYNPLLEPGDTVNVGYADGDGSFPQTVMRIQIPLSAGVMTVECAHLEPTDIDPDDF